MVEDTETRTKGSRKGKNTQVWVDNDATNKNELEAIDNEANKDTNSDSDFDDDVIKEYLTFNQVWRKIENSLTNEATKIPLLRASLHKRSTPRQASARTAGNDDQNKQARETEAKANNSHIITTRSKVLEAAAIGDASISTDYGEISLQNHKHLDGARVHMHVGAG
ncbi:hypothetical protein NDA17_006115 [Ustilago hordei]|nr:hypothetical protein NDA17_006115 [Ustilago hordei]